MSQDVSDPSVTDLPDGVGDWLAELAREQDVSEKELLSRLLGTGLNGSGVDELDDRLEEIRSDLDGLDARIDDLDDDINEKIDDVRERVIQVKREADAKAPEDHGHPELVSDIGDVAADVNALADEIGETEARVEDALADATDEVEAVRAEMDDFSEDVTRKLNVLAAAVVETRDQVRTLLAEREKRALVEELQKQANREGVRAADCENCSESVRIGLLAEPRCPHCNESFEELDPKDGFFGSNVLRTGDPPALEGDVASSESDLDDIIEE